MENFRVFKTEFTGEYIILHYYMNSFNHQEYILLEENIGNWKSVNLFKVNCLNNIKEP